ncbi:MAG: general secretion pathway protein GspM [Lysobacteraceae bacterium]|nr:MAG: general secretion pathway protein GspM [Xanthomonadaceae bacterium]
MTGALRALWQSRSPRERQGWLGVLALTMAVLYLALAGAALQSREPLRRDVEALRADMTRMNQQAAELAQLRALPPPAAPTAALRARVQSSLDDATLSSAVASLEAPDPGHAVVVFNAVAFSDWLAWLEGLAAQQVRLESCRIDALPASGKVNITATLANAGRP